MTDEPRNWMVYDGAKHDPWGTSQGDFGPMTETEARKFVADGAAANLPRHYFALPIAQAKAIDPKPAKRRSSESST